mgnify:CR=1 FL=1
MLRLFDTHHIRGCRELDGMWDFMPSNEKALPDRFDYTLPVPGCWEGHPSFSKYKGIGYYRRKVFLEGKKNLRLEFKGVSHTADVYWDGRFAGHHYNAYTPFSVIIPEAEPGGHEIVVRADNSFSEASALHIPNDYYSYGGILRPVSLEEIDEVFIERVWFTPKRSQGIWKANIKVYLRNLASEPRNADVRCLLNKKACLSESICVEASGSAIVEKECAFEDTEEIKEWTPEAPNLYLLETVLRDPASQKPLDDSIERVGFRTVTVSGKDILLNGRPVTLKGFNRHEAYARLGSAVPLQVMAEDLFMMRDMGANMVRTCHYPNDEVFLDLCDETGFLVWEENHARGLSLEQMQNPNFEKQCEDCIREMLENHYNHPSIIIWAILNECASHTPEGREMYKKQFDQIRAMDKTRPLTAACCHHFRELCYDLCDIVSMNIYSGWYQDVSVGEYYEKLISHVENTGGKNKPVIISEFGGGAIYGYRDPSRVKWSEERQADILEDCIRYYSGREEIKGLIIWQFADCRVDEQWFGTRPRTMNNKGVVDEYRRPKLAYETVKRLWGGGTASKI